MKKKHIYIYSPSGAVRDKAAFKRGVKRLEALGHEVEVDEAALASHQRFAGDDATRIAAISRAAASGADVTMISRGGYGLTRILPGLPYKQIIKAIERGTAFVGISDFTALQTAVFARAGLDHGVTWSGPALIEGFGQPEEPDEIMAACFGDLVDGQGEGTGWQLPKTETRTRKLSIEHAPLWGGNLAVLTSMLGTPYFPADELTRGGILFLEDVGEHPYRIERMLTQLLHAGILGRQKAILFGKFTEYQLTDHDRGFKLASVVDWLRGQIKTPILTGLPFGHVPTKVLLPVGACCDLLAQGREVLLVWGHDNDHDH